MGRGKLSSLIGRINAHMLFMLTEYENAATQVFGEAVDELAQVHHPILREIRKVPARVVRPSRLSGGDEIPLTLDTIEVRAPISLDAREIAGGDLGSVYVAADTLGDAKGGGIVKGMVEHISQITERTGNLVDAGGRPFSFDVYMETLETMEINFDEDGNPTFQILTSPEQAARMAALPPWTPDEQARYDALMARKRKEFEARKKTRRME
jgi:hypothetical protein